MPLLIPPGYGEATVLFSLVGDPEVMTVAFGFVDDGVTPAEDLADALYNPWATWVSTTWGSDYAALGLRVDINRAGVMLEGEIFDTEPGLGATAHPVQNTAMLVRKGSGLAGRANRGRWYLPPGRLAEADVNNYGLIDAADLAVIQGEVDTLFAGLQTAAGGDLVILHSEDVPAPGLEPPPTVITSLTVDQRVATQRRRLRG